MPKKAPEYDLAIIGAGPAGLAASIYASRYGIKHIVIGNILGGQISETHLIDNYPGIEEISGMEFSQKWSQHVKKYDAQIVTALVKAIDKKETVFKLKLESEEKIIARALLLATGTKRRRLNIANERKFFGRGISYCATCDGFFYKNKIVGVVGGANSAAGAALYLADICQKVYIIYRGEELRCEPFWLKEIKKNKNIEIICKTDVSKIVGQDRLKKIILNSRPNGRKELFLDGLFIEVGSDPSIDYAGNLKIETDEGGYVKIKKDGATNISGVWAAGDITDGSDKFRQVITAAAEGAIAVRSIFNWLKSQSGSLNERRR